MVNLSSTQEPSVHLHSTPRLQAALQEIVVHKYGHRVLLQLIAPSSLPPHVAAYLRPGSTPLGPAALATAPEAASDAEEVSDGIQSSA